MLTNVLLPASYCPRDLIPRICHTGETAINRGLAKRLEQMAKERERRERAAAAADEEFSAEFLTAARKVFQMIDDDDSGTLEKAEIVTAVLANRVENAASYDRAPFNLRGLRDLRRNCCFRVLGVWWCGIIQRPRHTSRRSQEVIEFLNNCGNQNLQYLLVPSRLEAALLVLDTDRDGHIDEEEWCVSEPATLGRLRRGDGVLVA